ncbi:MAG TPA: cysteine desulfurase [Candidatus Kaiserbacteria bacterium]|nr:cysteine desulfurase [Candidatus Kaiserbacteria bacterium]
MSNTAKSEHNHRIYLDHAGATPLSQTARKAMRNTAGVYGNPSSLHAEGRAANKILVDSRKNIAETLGVAPTEIIFTGSGSEADALALYGTAHAYQKLGRHIIVSAIEHKAILRTAEKLEREGFSVTYLPVASDGSVSPQALEEAMRPDTTLVSIMYANNEIGTVEPIAELAKVVQSRRGARGAPLFHTDACQAPGLLPIAPSELGIDLMTINGAKIYGPKGIALLYVRDGVLLEPLISGEQEKGRRGGTENIELIAGFAAALSEAVAMRTKEASRIAKLRDLLFDEIIRNIPNAHINGAREARLPNNVHISLPYIEGESVLLLLDAEGIACSTGSACSAHDLTASHVLRAIGQNPEIMHGSIRMTLGRQNTEADVRFVAKALKRATARLSAVSSLTVSGIKKSL